jgi:hypothetical protein
MGWFPDLAKMDQRNESRDYPKSDSSEKLQDSESRNSFPDPESIQNGKLAAVLAEKEDAIRRACKMRDLDALVSYASSEGGFLRDDLRQLACKSQMEMSVA